MGLRDELRVLIDACATDLSKDISRFWAKVKVRPDDCWEWTAYRSVKGYGKFGVGKKVWQAHRYAYTVFVGPVEKDLQLHHWCENPWCVNPDHMEVVTAGYHQLQLTPGGVGYENMRKIHCPQGHHYTAANTMYKKKKNGVIGRECRECDRARCRERYHRDPAKHTAAVREWRRRQRDR